MDVYARAHGAIWRDLLRKAREGGSRARIHRALLYQRADVPHTVTERRDRSGGRDAGCDADTGAGAGNAQRRYHQAAVRAAVAGRDGRTDGGPESDSNALAIITEAVIKRASGFPEALLLGRSLGQNFRPMPMNGPALFASDGALILFLSSEPTYPPSRKIGVPENAYVMPA